MLRRILIVAFFASLATVSAISAADNMPGGLSGVIDEASRMAIVDNGRIKPLQTYARYTLFQFSGRYSYRGTSAIAWLCKLMFNAQSTTDDAVFLINNPAVADAIGITPQKHRRYTFNQLWSGRQKLEEELRKIAVIDPEDRSMVENELVRTDINIRKYIETGAVFSFALPMPGFSVTNTALTSYLSISGPSQPPSYWQLLDKSDLLNTARKAADLKDRGAWTSFDSNVVILTTIMSQWQVMHQSSNFNIVPVAGKDGLSWTDPGSIVAQEGPGALTSVMIVAFVKAYDAYRNGDYAGCASALRDVNEETRKRTGENGVRFDASLELAYNAVNPFFWARLAYFAAFCFLIIGLLGAGKWWRAGGAIAIIAGVCLHLLGIAARVCIMHRSPVATQYEMFVFVALICVVLGLVLELFQKKGMGLFIASLLGAMFLYGSGKFGAEGDTMGMLAPVLNNNFWLAIHIITVSMGYAGCAAAGVLAHIYLVQRAFLKRVSEKLSESIYGMIAFGLTFTTIGTVLGGMWADQAWGRFWGWDPKENGALLIILWCAIIFHARIAGIIKEKGTAFGAIIGLMLVMLAWVGVNLLGVGLHAYGFSAVGARILFSGLAVELVFILIVSVKLLKIHHS
jgi:ABC-type transport system involved in cytochrome c biogenesis permease subunit